MPLKVAERLLFLPNALYNLPILLHEPSQTALPAASRAAQSNENGSKFGDTNTKQQVIEAVCRWQLDPAVARAEADPGLSRSASPGLGAPFRRFGILDLERPLRCAPHYLDQH